MRTVRSIKHLSFFLAIVLLLNLFASPVMAAQSADSEIPTATSVVNNSADIIVDSSDDRQSGYIPIGDEAYTELTDERTVSSKTYLLESKRFESIVFGLPVHYLEDGQYLDIDNSLELVQTESNGNRYTNRSNSFKASFATEIGDDPVSTITKDGYTLSWSISGLSRGTSALATSAMSKSEWSNQGNSDKRHSVANLSSQVAFRGVMPDVDLELQVVSDRIKENLVLNKFMDIKTINQTLTTDGLELVLQEDGSILAKAGETVVYELPAPFAYDANYDTNYDIGVTLNETTEPGSETSRTYQLTYELNTVWLAQASYPVTIDPTVLTSLNSSDIKDTRIVENYPTSNYYGLEFLSTGEGSSSGTNYTLIKFDNLPSIGSASMVQYSGLRLYKKSTSTVTSNVSVHKVTSTWTSSNVTWNTKPSFDSTVDDWQFVNLPSNVQYEWDITKMAKSWYTGGTNYGLLLKDMSSTGGYKEFWSADAVYYPQYVPYAYFVYTNYSGLEGYWDYTSSSFLGRSGTANVNLYNGNLVYTHSDVSMTGNRLPIAVTHVFNSTTKDTNDSKMLYGKGWRTNYDQRVSYVTIAGVNYYQYTDEDGTIHYFKSVSGVWKDESGLDFKLTVSSNIVTITDKSDNILKFYATNDSLKPGFLNYIEDRNGNRQTVGYDGNGRINQITDPAGRIVKFIRDGSGNLTQIGEPTASNTWRYTTFAYSSSRLASITYPDGEVTTFTYDSHNNIDYVNGIANDKLDLTYTSAAPYRIIYMGESATVGGTTTDGGHAHLTYGYNRTTFEDSEGRKATYQFNDFGNTVCVTGPDGGAAFASYGTTPTSGEMSKMLAASNFQKYGENLLKNHNMEVDDVWHMYSGSGSTGTYGYSTDQKYLGSRSAKFYKSNTTEYEAAFQTVNLTKGQTYTLSGYVKTSSVSVSGAGAYLYAGYFNSSGGYQTSRSSYLRGTNDWTKLSVTFTVPADSTSTTVYLYYMLYASSGTAWFDCLQLEEGSVANRYNMVENSDFTYTTSNMPIYWTANGCTSNDKVITTSDSTNPVTNNDSRFIMYGEPGIKKWLVQDLHQSGLAGDTYIAGAWAKAASVSLTSGPTRDFAVFVYFNYTDPTKSDEWLKLSFSEDSNNWQYISNAFVAKYDYQQMTIRVQYQNNANTAEFDGMQLFKEQFGNTYTYDSSGNLKSVVDSASQTEQFNYNTNNDLTSYIDSNGKTFTYTYDSNHNILTATSAEGIVYTFTYDSYGNQTSAKVGGSTNYVKSNVSYTSGNYTDIVTDPFGEQVDYNYDSYKGTPSSVVDPLGNTVSNTYNSNTDYLTQTSQTSGSVTMSNSYTYLDDRLTNVSHNNTSGSVGYDFQYNDLGWMTGVKVNGASTNLITYTLQARTGRVNALTYGNGDVINYTYDSYDQLKKVSEGSTGLYEFEYDYSGNLGYLNDLVQDKEYRYEYDSLHRLGKITSVDSAGKIATSEYSFNNTNSLSQFLETIDGTTYQTNYSYDDDSRPVATTYGSYSKNWGYDTSWLNQANMLTLKYNSSDIYKTQVNYQAGDGSTSTKSYRISSIVNDYGSGSPETLSYIYDERGYITQVYKDSNNYSQYRYDAFGQLVRENYKWGGTSFTKIFSYDVGGNITSQVQYAFVAGDGAVGTAVDTVSYGYTDSTWKDKLTSFDGNTITYDNIGNPLSDGTWTYSWTQGRKLEQISKSGTTASYKYNSDGIRTEKTVNGVTTVYNVVGGKVTWEKTGSNTPMYYLYDASGKLWAVQYNSNTYLYVRNAQGDITKLINNAGDVVVEYTYDAWGNLMSTTGSMASTLGAANPYRYRGYRYDTETGLYYLQSRYYNPQWGRFVNADGQINTDDDSTGLNLFANCGNNPVNRVDESGHAWWHWAIAAAVVVVAAAAVVVTAGGATPALIAAASVVNGCIAMSTASTVAAGTFVGASLALGTTALIAAGDSDTAEEFFEQGNWGTVATTVGGGVVGGGSAYLGTKVSSPSNKSTANPLKNTQVNNDVINLPRAGKALKTDPHHAFPDIVDNYAGYATKTPINNGTLYQLQGSLNGSLGRFEWIIQDAKVTHRFFVSGDGMNGIPIMS